MVRSDEFSTRSRRLVSVLRGRCRQARGRAEAGRRWRRGPAHKQSKDVPACRGRHRRRGQKLRRKVGTCSGGAGRATSGGAARVEAGRPLGAAGAFPTGTTTTYLGGYSRSSTAGPNGRGFERLGPTPAGGANPAVAAAHHAGMRTGHTNGQRAFVVAGNLGAEVPCCFCKGDRGLFLWCVDCETWDDRWPGSPQTMPVAAWDRQGRRRPQTMPVAAWGIPQLTLEVATQT